MGKIQPTSRQLLFLWKEEGREVGMGEGKEVAMAVFAML